MRSPIKNLKNKTNSLSTIKDLIPKGSIVQSYPFYDGVIEFSLSELDRYVIGATRSPMVHEFWRCAEEDPKRISLIADKMFVNLNENTFDLLRKNWYSYKDPFVRSALFYLLNRCSTLGMISHGELNTDNYNPLSISELRTFKVDNFHCLLIPEDAQYNSIESVEINIFNAGNYYFDALDTKQIVGLEESKFQHTKFLNDFNDRPSIFIYKMHPRLCKINNYSKIFIDRHGRKSNQQNAEEIILHNV